MNQCILVCLVQTHMVTVGVHAEGTHSSETLTSLCDGEGGVYMEGGAEWLQGVLFVPGCLVTQPVLVLPGHVSHRPSLLFTFLMRGAGLCDM